MKILGIGSTVKFSGHNLKVVAITKTHVEFQVGAQVFHSEFAEVESRLAQGQLKVLEV